MDLDCDPFEGFNQGTTAAERLRSPQGEWSHVQASMGNLYELLRFCT